MENVVTVNVQLQLNRKGMPFKDQADMLSWISGCLNCNTNHVEATVTPAEVPTAIVNMNGGLIHQIKASGPMRIIVLDGDTEGANEDEVSTVDGEEVVVINHGDIDIAAEYVQSVVAQVEIAEG